MEQKKPRTINYFELIKKDKSLGDEFPASEMKSVLNSVATLEFNERILPVKGKKTYLSHIENRTGDIQLGTIVSLITKYRPDVVDENSGSKRENPKNLNEGDEEKTHFAIKYLSDRVVLLIETNAKGIFPKNVPVYFKFLCDKFPSVFGDEYNLKYVSIAIDDFHSALNRMKRAKMAEIFIDKQMIGSHFLGLSNRLNSVKQTVKLIVSSEKKQSIKDFSEDVYQIYSRNGDKVNKITIVGTDEDDSPIKIDTSFAEKKAYIYPLVNADKGDINSIDAYRELVNLLSDL